MASIGLLRRVAVPEADLEVQLALLSREVNPADWLELYLQQGGHKTLRERRLQSPFGEVGDVLTKVIIDSKTYVERSMAIKDGPRLFLVQGRVGESGYPKVAEEFLIAFQTFALTNPSGEHFVEPMAIYKFDAPLAAKFLFPKSWNFKEDPHPLPGGTTFSLLNVRANQSFGQFTFAAIPRGTAEDHQKSAELYLHELRKNGITVPDQKLEQGASPAGFQAIWESKLSGQKNGQKLDIQCCILEHQNAWLLFAVTGPDKETNVEAQMINSRACRVALETLVLL